MFSPNVQAIVALVLLGLSLPALVHVGGGVADHWAGTRERRWLVGAMAVAAVLRWLVAPLQIATMYIGYLLTEQAIELQPDSHYGVGSQALYHALFAFLPHDHRALMAVNAVVGVMVIPFAATLAARLFDDRRTGILFGWLLACVPLFVRNDTSDANNVPWLLWFCSGLLALLVARKTLATLDVVAATVLLTHAAIARPEMPLLVPALITLALLGAHPARDYAPHLRRVGTWLALGLSVACILPHALHVRDAVDTLGGRSSLPGSSRGSLLAYLVLLVRRNTLLDPGLYPLGCVAAALVGVVMGNARRRLRVALLGMIGVSLAPYLLDLCRANMARVHVPAALWLTMLAAHGLAVLWTRGGVRAAIAALVLVAASALPNVRVLWAPTNEQTEEAMIQRSLANLPAGRFTLVRMANLDRSRRAYGTPFTHDHFPDYLLRPPVRHGRASSIRDFTDEPEFDEPVFFYLGMRCYAEFRDEGTRPPHGEALQPACAQFRERFELEPVFERDVVNYGDVWLAYYGDAPTFRIGLYRVTGRARPEQP